MLPDRRRRCSVLPYCGACRAVWSERRRRGCICSPPPIGGNHDRLNLLRLRGSRHHHRSRSRRRCREHRRGKSGRRRTRPARNRWDRRSLARLEEADTGAGAEAGGGTGAAVSIGVARAGIGGAGSRAGGATAAVADSMATDGRASSDVAHRRGNAFARFDLGPDQRRKLWRPQPARYSGSAEGASSLLCGARARAP